ncbi:hypothetical protein DL769_002693 [Monosporascus sp. CRB-8-3]|nr:hypothetical protein DL769_002693 [Monosporascus sp. CRB-8-3]
MDYSRLFQPVQIGSVTPKHRIVMAPMTRFRADDTHVPMPMAESYYAQRATYPGTLIISEATFISPAAGKYANGSYMFLQLWALGRVADPVNAAAENIEIVSSSPNPLDPGSIVPKELSREAIQEFVQAYARAARNAVEAGFDGVEIHGAGGYLIDQFTEDKCNQRTDIYGGSIENRGRFVLEVARAVSDAIGSDKVGIRLSPWQRYQGMRMDDPIPQFTYVIKELKAIGLAYLHLIEARVCGNTDSEDKETLDFAIKAWGTGRPPILAGGYTPSSAVQTVDKDWKGYNVLIAFGRHFTANPDLPFRIKHQIKLHPYDRSTFYVPKSFKGYADYPLSPEYLAQQ